MEISSLDTRKLYLQRAPYIINIRPLPLTLLLMSNNSYYLHTKCGRPLIVLANAVV